MPVTEPTKDYQDSLYKWRIVRDCAKGAQAVKAARRMEADDLTGVANEPGTFYLPAPNPWDTSVENKYRYNAYRTRANYVNFVGHTKEALAGMVCRKQPIVELPLTIEEMLEDVNGEGESLESVIKRTLDEVLLTGRQGILTDYPEMPPGLTRAQTQGVKPYFTHYAAESIINWKMKPVGGRSVLCMVVLKEQEDEQLDEFSTEAKDRYRVLMLNDDGVYVQRLYNEDGELLVDRETGESDIIPRDSSGGVWREIPFVFVGSVNNDARPDKSVLYDLAEVNIAHYRNSADYEESCFLVGQPTPVITGLNQGWLKDVLKGKIEMGSRGGIPLPEGGSAMLLQAAPNQMPSEGMERKEKQMIQIGAKIITDSGQAETAEAAKIRFAGQNSKLGTIVSNIEEAYQKCLKWALMFAGGSGEIELEINKEFYDKNVDPQMLMAKVQLLDRGVISVKDVRDHLRKSGDIDEERTDEDIENDRMEVNPFA